MKELEKRVLESATIKPDRFIIYDVHYLGTVDNYLFGGFQETKFGEMALYTGVLHYNTICLSTIKELIEMKKDA